MNVNEIIIKYLEEIGADGLCTDNCGCPIDDIAPCDGYIGWCKPAKLVPCSNEHDHDEAEDGKECFQEI